MIKVVLSCSLFYVVIAATTTTTAPWKQPSFCHDLACPVYTVLQTFPTYEVRMYEPSVWVSTSFNNVTLEHSVSTGLFFKLFSYIQGNNKDGIKMAMTAPVLDEIDSLPNGLYNVTRYFMLPFEHQANPPAPTDPTVFITRLPAMKVYVDSFPGFDIEGHRAGEISKLEAAINNNAVYDHTRIFSAGYDSPFSFVNRHNEVWLMAV